MTSGHGSDEITTSGDTSVSDATLKELDDVYGASTIASLVVEAPGRIAYCNEAATKLFDIDAPQPLDALAAGESCALVELIERARKGESQPVRWRGTLRQMEVSVELVLLPKPSHTLLCRVHPCRNVDEQTRTRLISELSSVRRRRADLSGAGKHLVETIHDHLNIPVVVLVHQQGDEKDRWWVGDEHYCRQMASSVFACPPQAETETGVVELDDEPGTVVLTLRIGEATTATLLLATRTHLRWIEGPTSFWNCLATTAEATLQTARLLEMNRRRRHRLRAVIEQMPMAMMLFDCSGRVLDLNLRARALVDRRDWDHVIDDDPPYEVCNTDGEPLPRDQWPLTRAVREGWLCEEEEYILDFGDRRRTVSVTVVPITDDDGEVTSYMATGHDVTRRSEQDRRRDEFLSVATHELRSPITPLSGLLHLAKQQCESERSVDPQLLERARSQVARLKRLIDGLLDVSRLETGKLPVRRRDTEMRQLLTRVMTPWKEGEHGERIQLDCPDAPITAAVDPDRIDQVVTNVVDNAVKHARADGQITVSLRADEDRQMVSIRVADEGDGMAQSVVDRVFDRYFFAEKSNSSGAGLGLYIARQIVEDHSGEIDIDTAPGEPTTVTIRLPAAAS